MARLPALNLPHSEAEQRLRERINRAKDISPGRIRSFDELILTVEREKRWHVYNLDMLRSMFTTEKYASEYACSRKSVNVAGARDNNLTLGNSELRMNENLRSQVASLESIVERLEFAGKPTTASPSQTMNPSASPGRQEILALKPGMWGMSIDVKEIGRRVKSWWQKRRGAPS